MTEIMPVPRNLNFTVLPAESFPALFILNALFPLYGLAYAQTIAEVILSVLAVFVLVRLFHRLEADLSVPPA